MASMKYLVNEYEQVFIFDERIEHRQFATMFGQKMIRGGRISVLATYDEKNFDRPGLYIQCFGEAFSLGLHIDKEKDQELIKRKIEG